ncbi:MAG: S8 family serine peptidase, partial [Egibacteraceae bacterium]
MPQLTRRPAALRRVLALTAALSVALSLVGAPGVAKPRSVQSADLGAITADKAASKVYIVRFSGEPATSFEGGTVAGQRLARTAPRGLEKLDKTRPAVRELVGALKDKHNAALRAAGVADSRKLYDYTYSFNGMAARLTAAQAAELRARSDVLSVQPQFFAKLQTDNSPKFLGITERQAGLWARNDEGSRAGAGEGMIVGVVDTGIWPEHASFADTRNPNRPAGRRNPVVFDEPPSYWRGACEFGEDFGPGDCNNKLIGARYFGEGFYGNESPSPQEYDSPRDADGHGSHTTGTAAGRERVRASVLGNSLGRINGMAPRAHVAAYKACWEGQNGGCAGADLVAAIDTAVADGVDVINYSIGSSASTLLSPDAIAFLFAQDAGVFVANSAGNSGPGAATLGSPSSVPWLTSVGASTQTRDFRNEVILSDGRSFSGVSLTQGTDGDAELRDAENHRNALCLPGEFKRARRLRGKIVLCARGQNARVEKSLAVQQVGGAGMILHNTVPNDTLNTDNHYVPSSHVAVAEGQQIKAFIAERGRQFGRITAGEAVRAKGNSMAAFSSRGPNRAAPDLIGPDVTAPGVNILAGNTPTPFLGSPGELFQAISGTSMSGPHVAGIATLLKQLHPSWSPAMIKSALVTSGRQNITKEDGTTPADPFDFGGGHIVPNGADEMGLVYDADTADYLDFLEGSGIDVGGWDTSIDPSDLNLPSIGIAELAGRQTVTREVTNVGPRGTYRADVEAPAGVNVGVSPAVISPRGGQTEQVEITFTSTDGAALDAWAFGSLTWVNQATGAEVRSPIGVKPVALSAPDEIEGTGASGSQTYEVTFGYDGEFLAAPRGLVPPTETEGNVADDPDNSFDPVDGSGFTIHEITVDDATEYTRFSLFDDETDGADDLDL